jgi:hypothetical protein
MSDKTPTPDQPESTEPTPADTAAEPTPVNLSKEHTAESTEPTPEPTPEHTAESTETLPPTHTDVRAPKEKKSRRGLLVPIVAVVLVLALVGGGLVAFFALRSDAHKIVTPTSAGGMKRDSKTETQLKTALADAENQFKAQDKLISTTSSAIYAQNDTKRGPKGGVVFLGGKLKKSDDKAATKFLATVRKQATANGFKVTSVDPGDGAKALCAAQAQGTQKIAICAWATGDTRGEVLPTVSGWETPTLSKVMKSLRADVEVAD